MAFHRDGTAAATGDGFDGPFGAVREEKGVGSAAFGCLGELGPGCDEQDALAFLDAGVPGPHRRASVMEDESRGLDIAVWMDYPGAFNIDNHTERLTDGVEK